MVICGTALDPQACRDLARRVYRGYFEPLLRFFSLHFSELWLLFGGLARVYQPFTT